MKKSPLFTLLLTIICLNCFGQQNLTNYTTLSINNGVVVKGEKYNDALKVLFPELASLQFTKKTVAGYTVKILIDSAEVVNVTNTVVPLDNNASNSHDAQYQQREKYFYKINYRQNVFKITLLNDKGVVVNEKALPAGTIFTATYTKEFMINENATPDYYHVITPQQTTQRFLVNNPPDDFVFKTNIKEALNVLVQANNTAAR